MPLRFRALVYAGSLLALALVACGGGGREEWRIATRDPATRRVTPSGEIVGGEGRYGSHAWLGIPYAEPPVGALRWRAPRPAKPWSGTREALAFGAPCPQYASPLGGVAGAEGEIVGDEDCLTLNVWAPRFAADAVPREGKRLPVMVWIHGGGNTIGATPFYDGGNLAATHGLVVVSVQYRLGPLGWLRHRALRAEASDPAEASGNFSTLDLVRALEWVRANASAFGGDATQVTIFGESAGGRNVYTLLLAPQARGLFQRAIVESGGLWNADPAEAENFTDDAAPGHAQSSNEIAARLLVKAGEARDRAEAKARLAAIGDARIASFLRARSAREVLGAYDVPANGLIQMPIGFGDGAMLPPGDGLDRLGSADGWNRVPVIVGTNRDENRLFMFGDPRWVRKLLGFLPRFVDEPRFLETAEYLARMWKATGADEPAARMRAHEPNVFVYRFDWDEEPTRLGADLSKMLGASHGFEIPFVFGHFDLGRAGNVIYTEANAPGRQELSRAMMSYWAEFARGGAPGRGRAGDLPEWTAVGRAGDDAPATLVLDTPQGGGIRMAAAVESRAGVLASVDTDPRLGTQKDRCRIFRELALFGRGLPKKDYPTAGKAGCAEFPLESHPWE